VLLDWKYYLDISLLPAAVERSLQNPAVDKLSSYSGGECEDSLLQKKNFFLLCYVTRGQLRNVIRSKVFSVFAKSFRMTAGSQQVPNIVDECWHVSVSLMCSWISAVLCISKCYLTDMKLSPLYHNG
jgi:hypothetical protein